MSSSTTTTSSRRNHRRNDNSNISPSAMTSTIILALVAMTGFFLGTLFTMHAGLGHCDNNNNNNSNNNNDNTNDINNLKGSNNDKIEQMAQKRFLGKSRVLFCFFYFIFPPPPFFWLHANFSSSSFLSLHVFSMKSVSYKCNHIMYRIESNIT